jgi:endonuclease YncB( thermonuclease family)
VRKWIVPAVLAVALVIGANSGRDDVERTSDDETSAAASAAETAAEPARADASAADPELTVTNVVDGDTLDLSDGRRVRVLGIDTPEKGECGFEKARDFARATLLDSEVDVASDPTQDGLDRYGRSLLYVKRWGLDYSHAVIGAGWAEHIVVGGVPVEKAETLQYAEDAAKALKLGIWGDPCAPPTPASPTTTHRAKPPAESDGDADVQRLTPPVVAVPEREPQPAPRPAPRPQPQPVREPSGRGCHSSYVPCVPESPRDLDCKDVGHRVTVVGPDEYRLDGDDNDGKGCESYPAA